MLMISFGIQSWAQQMYLPNLRFTFANKSVFEQQFPVEHGSKTYSVSISGINQASDIPALKQIVLHTRGVESFTIENGTQAGVYTATLKVYANATGWWYWKTFMSKTGVRHFTIGEANYTPETIGQIN